MREVLAELQRWSAEGRLAAIARVVQTDGSGPRDAGAAMAVSDSGEVVGSVSGGCVEGAVVTEALEILHSWNRRIVSFGYSDEDAFAVGLTCGGTVHLFIEPYEPSAVIDELVRHVDTGRPAALATIVAGIGVGAKLLVTDDQAPLGSLGTADLDRVVIRDARAALDTGTSSTRHYGEQGEIGERNVSVFIESFAAPPRLFIFGAIDFTSALCSVAKILGFHVTVCDAREMFATNQRFPLADEVIVDWPNRLIERIDPPLTARDAICVLTHDTKFDVPAIIAALRTDVGYIGAMGSRRTAERRRDELHRAGARAEDLMRVNAPIGLDLGGRSPEETAISIGAEIIAQRNGRTTASLRNTGGPIHG